MRETPQALSEGLDALIQNLTPYHDVATVTVSGAELRRIVHAVRVMRLMAVTMERELAVQRMRETDRRAASFLDRSASDAMAAMARDPEGKVLDFRRETP